MKTFWEALVIAGTAIILFAAGALIVIAFSR